MLSAEMVEELWKQTLVQKVINANKVIKTEAAGLSEVNF